jgi:type I restriction enzyme, S subunit
VIPPGWTKARFADVADYKAGRTPARAMPEYWTRGGDGVPWVAISDMTSLGRITRTREKITQAAFEQVFRGEIVRAGTLIMSFKLTIGRVATLEIDACHNEAIISIYPKRAVNQRFLGYFLAQVDYDALQDRQVKGNTLNQEKIDRIEILLPPTNEQASIADVLDSVRLSIELQDSILSTANDLKHAVMRRVFTHGLNGELQQESELGPVPESWNVVTLGTTCALSTGTTPSTKRQDYYEGDVPFIKTAEIVNNRLREVSTHISRQAIADYGLRIYPAGTVLMAMYGQGKTRGQVALLELPATTTQNAAAIEPDSTFDSAFLWHYLLRSYERLRGMGSLGHLSHLNLGYLREILVIRPPIDEQRDIVAILDAIDCKINLHVRKRAVLDDLFKSLLHKLMTGEIRVADLDLSALEKKADTESAA